MDPDLRRLQLAALHLLQLRQKLRDMGLRGDRGGGWGIHKENRAIPGQYHHGQRDQDKQPHKPACGDGAVLVQLFFHLLPSPVWTGAAKIGEGYKFTLQPFPQLFLLWTVSEKADDRHNNQPHLERGSHAVYQDYAPVGAQIAGEKVMGGGDIPHGGGPEPVHKGRADGQRNQEKAQQAPADASQQLTDEPPGAGLNCSALIIYGSSPPMGVISVTRWKFEV